MCVAKPSQPRTPPCGAVLALLVAFAVSSAPIAPAERAAPTSFLWPAQGTVTAPYGSDGGRWHPGIDIGILRSLEVRAAAAGTVLRVGLQRGYEGYGNVIEIGVGDGYTTLYGHLARARVRKGQEVETGDAIGLAGCTGWCTGTHLHFELRLHGRAVNPNRIPLGYTRTPRAVSSVGRAPARQAGGHWFEPSTAHLSCLAAALSPGEAGLRARLTPLAGRSRAGQCLAQLPRQIARPAARQTREGSRPS